MIKLLTLTLLTLLIASDSVIECFDGSKINTFRNGRLIKSVDIKTKLHEIDSVYSGDYDKIREEKHKVIVIIKNNPCK